MADRRLRYVGMFHLSEPEFVGRFPIRVDIPVSDLHILSSIGVSGSMKTMLLYGCTDCGRVFEDGRLHSEEECIILQVMRS